MKGQSKSRQEMIMLLYSLKVAKYSLLGAENKASLEESRNVLLIEVVEGVSVCY